MTYQVSGLYVYPIKSLAGIALPQSLVEPEGLQYDRRWMLVDANRQFLSQRQIPELCLFNTAITQDGIHVWNKHNPDDLLQFGFEENTGQEIEVHVWQDTVKAAIVNPDASNWFSSKLNRGCQLVKLNSNTQRRVDPAYAHHNETTSFADAFPVLIIGRESLNELNRRLTEKVSMKRFRPNIVFEGGTPFDEDQWRKLRIGTVELRLAKPCARCVITTIDPDTGNGGQEPLKTLAAFRSQNNKVMFGQNALVTTAGQLSLSDVLTLS